MAHALTAAEFEKLPRGPYRFDRWRWREEVSTLLGPFAVSLQMLGKDDTGPPDDEMLRRASELVAYARANADYILDLVFGHYLFVSEQPAWLESCGVPRNLTRNQVADFLGENRSLVVSRHLNWREPYNSCVFAVPQWESEHALILDFREGAIATVNDCKFRLESGVLRWVRE
jgi:hypothetical protein